VAGLTVENAERKIEGHLAERLESPDVSVEVYAYNSKVYYVIHQGDEKGDVVTRLPVTGNETVLDAISQVPGLAGMSNKHIWIARPQPGGAASDSILQVNWQEITAGAATANNYQLLPGDRVLVAKRSSLERAAEGALRFLERARSVEESSQQLEHFIGEER
jgi:polysaccharide export outer membrane protein